MSDDDKPADGGPGTGGAGGRRPDRPDRSGARPDRSRARPERKLGPGAARREGGGWSDRAGTPAHARRAGTGRGDPDRRASTSGRPPAFRSTEREDERPRHDDPPIPDEVLANQLDKGARSDLRTLSKDNADGVARHLIMAGRLIDEDPALAHRHALAAARRAGRVAVVRESLAITAYATGDFALALRELRTYRRLSGRNDQLPLMVDSERGVGRPDRALETGRAVPRAELDVAVQVGLAIAMSGARLDLAQPELALVELQIPQLDPSRAFSWSPMLFDAYATVLEELGRADEAAKWFAHAEAAADALDRVDDDGSEETVEIVEEEIVEDELPGESEFDEPES